MKTFVKSLLMTLMLFVTVVAKAQTPAACQLTLTVTNENKPYAVNVKVKTPTTDADGNALASLKKMEVYRDGALIFSVDDPYMGSNVRTDDENVPEGKHVYMAVAYGADGTRGVEVEKELTFGNATPEPATPAACTLTLTVTNETKPYAVNVKVRTPSVDTKGNALASLKKMEVYRDGAMIFSVDNPYMGSNVRTDDENVPEGKHVYMAVAYGADGTRGEEVSQEITFGNATPEPATPAACTLTLMVTNETKPYAVNVKVKTPSVDTKGNALASLKKVEVYRDGAMIFSVDNPYMGSSVRTDDENVPEGKHVYMAVAYGADGTRGEEVSQEITFGNATPEPATPAACTLTLTVTNETKPYAVNVKVKTPSVDTKGNALASLKKVEVYRDGAMIFSVDNPYMGSSVRTDDENVPEGKHVYMAVAYGADGTRGEEVSKEITFGNAEPDPGTGGNTDPEPQPTILAVPFTHAFNSAASLDGFTIIDANNDGKKWAFDSSLGMAACGYNDFGSANDWLISPAVALEAGKTYTIEYMGSAYTNNGETVSISLGKGNTVAAMTTTVLPAAEYELPFGSAVPIKAEFTATETDNFNIGLHMTTSSMMFGGTMFLKSFAMAEKAGDEPVITPAACQLTLTVTNENKPYALNAKVKTPSVDTDGNALAGLKKVELLRDGVVIFSVDNPYLGSSVRTDDENVPEGKHVYTAYAYSLDGVRGEEVSKEIIFGTVAPEPDAAPQAVTNVVAVYDPETSKSTITWTAPTKGKNGVDLNGAVTYNIRRKGSYDLIASGLAETTFVDEVSLDNQALSAYYVTAVNEAGNSSEVKSNDLFIGKPYEIPFTETATNGVMQNTWQITRTGSSRWGASDLGNIAYDNDRGYITFCPLMENDGSTLTSGIINVADAANPSFRFHYFYVMPGDDRFDVSVKVDGGEPVKVWSYDYEDEDAVEQWMEVTLPLKEVLNGGKYVQLVFDTQMAMPQQPILYLDDISVIDRRENDLQVTMIKAPRTLKAGEDRSALIRIDNLGENDYEASSYNILAKVGDKVISTTKGPKVRANDRKEFTISDIRLDVFNNDTEAELYFALDVEDEDETNNVTEKVAVEVKPVYVEAPINAVVEEGEKAVLRWEAPVAKDVTSQASTESFEDAPSFTIDDFAEWAVYDGLNTSVYGLSSAEGDVVFPNACAPQAWIVMDYGTGQFYDSFKPSTGNKMMAAFSHAASVADSWLISPELSGEAQTISLAAKAATSSYRETFNILYSTNANRDLSTFKVLEGSKTNAKASWNTYEFDLPEGARYFVIHCISDDALALLVDDVNFIPEATGKPCTTVKGYNIYRDGEKINDATIKGLTFTDVEGTSANVYNVTAVYETDSESRPSEAAVTVPSAIKNAASDADDAEMYSISGQRVDKNYRGVVIKKNKKVLVK